MHLDVYLDVYLDVHLGMAVSASGKGAPCSIPLTQDDRSTAIDAPWPISVSVHLNSYFHFCMSEIFLKNIYLVVSTPSPT